MATTALVKARDSTRVQVRDRRCSALEEVYNVYLAGLDPRGESEESEALRLALAIAGESDNRFRHFLDCLSQRRCKHWSLVAIARSCEISLPEFVEFWRKAQMQRALVIAINGMPAVVKELIAAALGREEACERCDCLGWVFVDSDIDPAFIPGGVRVMTVFVQVEGKKKLRPVERHLRTCPACQGTGLKPKPGDLEAAKLVGEIAGLTGKKATVQINNNVGGAGFASRVDRLRDIPFHLDDDVIDVEPEPSDPEPSNLE